MSYYNSWITDEALKVLVEDFKMIFGEDHLPDRLEGRLADEVKYNSIEIVQKTLECLRTSSLSEDQKKNPYQAYIDCWVKLENARIGDIQKADEQESPAGNTQSQDEKAEKQTGFTKLSHLFTNRMRYIPPAPFKVYVFLRSYVNQEILNKTGEMKAWPSHETICYRTGYSEHTVIEAIRCLKLLGFIKISLEIAMSIPF